MSIVNLTVPLSEDVAAKVTPIVQWLSPILELSLIGFRSPASETAAEIVHFFSGNPSAQDVLAYHLSERAQTRAQRLLTLNVEGLLGEAEQRELEEIAEIEHVVRRCKIEVARAQKEIAA